MAQVNLFLRETREFEVAMRVNAIVEAMVQANPPEKLLELLTIDVSYINLEVPAKVGREFARVMQCSVMRTALEDRLKAAFNCDYVILYSFPLDQWGDEIVEVATAGYKLSLEDISQLEGLYKRELKTVDLTTSTGLAALKHALERQWMK